MLRSIPLLLPLALCSPLASAADGGSLLVSDVRLVDMASGTVGARQDIVIRDGGIVAVEPHASGERSAHDLDADVRVLDGGGAHVIPGLWDAHVHVFANPEEPAVAFDTYLINGVTGIRDMGGPPPFETQRRIADEVESGVRRGPRVVLSGAWVDGPRAPGPECSSPTRRPRRVSASSGSPRRAGPR